MAKGNISHEIEIPEGVEVKIEDGIISAKGPAGENSRRLVSKKLNISKKDNAILIQAENTTKREKKLRQEHSNHTSKIYFLVLAKIYTYQLKICSSHFPITAEIKDNVMSVKNLLGESVPRKIKLKQGADVKVEGEIIKISSSDKELAGTIASLIEAKCKVKGRDRRIFQDGIFIISKAEQETE